MKSRLALTVLMTSIAACAVAPSAASAAFDGNLCDEGASVLTAGDGKLCTIRDRPYGYPHVALTDTAGTTTYRKRPVGEPAFPAANILGGKAAPATSLRFDLMRDDTNQNAPVVIVEHGGSWMEYNDPLFGKFAGGRGWGEPTARYMAYRGFVAVTSDTVTANQNQIKRMGLDTVAREGQRNRQTLIRLLKAEHERFGIDPNRIYATGESAGGAEALRLALRSEDQGDVAARRLVGIDDSGVDSTVRGAFATGGADCGFPGAKPELLRAGRKVFSLTGDWVKYFAAPNLMPVFSTKVATYSPSLLQSRMPFYKWTNGAHDQVLDFETDKGFSTCGPSKASSQGDAPFGLLNGAKDELLPIENSIETCAMYLPPRDPRGLCDAFYAIDSPNTYYGGLNIDATTDYAARHTWDGNLALAEWPTNLTTWPGMGADHWMTMAPFAKTGAPAKNYDPKLSWGDEDFAIRFAWFCKHGANVPLCSSVQAPQ
ncbi:MAG: hypothetical protein JHC95_09030 [Solirubrobacteraceae bacterium]|nr:hypothetical protein [Solirubrobacteraceae bacterium]